MVGIFMATVLLVASETAGVVTQQHESAKKENPKSLPTLRGLESRATTFALSSRRGSFSLDSPLYRTRLPDISNHVGPVRLFLSTLLSFHLKEFFSFVLLRFFFPCIDDDHGSPIIFRSVSVRPKYLFDQNVDHDYYFKLPFQGAGCPIQWTMFYCTSCPVPSCPAYEPNSNDGEYAHPFRHIQYKPTASLRPIAPWQCSCADASPGEGTDVSSLDEYAPLPGPPLPTKSAVRNCLAC